MTPTLTCIKHPLTGSQSLKRLPSQYIALHSTRCGRDRDGVRRYHFADLIRPTVDNALRDSGTVDDRQDGATADDILYVFRAARHRPRQHTLIVDRVCQKLGRVRMLRPSCPVFMKPAACIASTLIAAGEAMRARDSRLYGGS